MKAFKFMSIVAGVMALAALAGCQQKVEDPYINLVGNDVLTLDQNKTTVTVKIITNRDWAVRMDAKTSEWMVVEPSRGTASTKPIEVTLTVTENTGANRTAAIEFYTGVATAMLTVKQAGPKGDSDGVETITVADFISKADKTTYYRLTGKVSSFQTGTNSSGKNWMQFNLTDDTSTILVYGFANGQYEEWSGKIKNGGTVTLQGQYEFYSSKSQHEVVNATIESFTPGEEQTEITSSTVADFIAKASGTIYYRLTGTVSDFKTGNNNGRDWMQFILTDDTGSILVYGFKDGQFDTWSSKIKNNGTVVLVGTYQYYEKNNQHEVMNTTIESFKEGEAQQTVTGTVAETCAATDGTPVEISEATVVAKSKVGLVVADATGAVYLFFDSKKNETVPDVAIGDKVKVAATKTTYGGVPEFTTATVTKLSSGEVTYPEPKDLTPIALEYASGVTEFVKMTGTLKISGNYINIEINGVAPATRQGSVSQPLDALGVNAFDGKEITITGYFTGITTSKDGVSYVNIVATGIALADPNAKYCSVNPTAINVKADATSATFTIAANAAWTVTSDNDAFTVEPASGDADATVTVSFSANESDQARVAHLTVACADASVETVVVLTQARASSGDATIISIDFTAEIADLPQAKANGKIDGTYTLGGYEFIMHAEGKYNGADNLFYQAKSNDKLYLLIGRKNAYIQLPVVEGKALTKVAFLTGESASTSVVVDVAKADGTRLNVNNTALNKGTSYSWDIVGEVGQAYKLLVVSDHNAQFQNLTLTYE